MRNVTHTGRTVYMCAGYRVSVCVCVYVWFYCNFRAMIDYCNHLYAIYEHKADAHSA